MPGQSKVYVGIGAWLALSILSFTISGFIVGAFGIVLIHTNWPNLITHLSNIGNSGGLPKKSGQVRNEGLAAEQDWQGEQTSDEKLTAGQDWHGEHTMDEDLAVRQETQSKESKLASSEGFRNITRASGDAPRKSEQPDELLREAKQALKTIGRGASYEDSANKARAISLLTQIIGRFPNSKEAGKARTLMDKLRGF